MPQSAPNRPRLSRRRRRLYATIGLLTTLGVILSVGGFVYLASHRGATYLPGESIDEITRKLERGIPADAPTPTFTNVTQVAGLGDFRTFVGPRSSQLPEDMGGGAAWGDFDGDGDDDLFLVSAGGSLNSSEHAASELYENLGDGTFRRFDGFPKLRVVGMAAAWGDYDGDTRLDLVVSGYNALKLYRNDRGRFTPDDAIPDLPGFWAGVSWADFDRDGDIDLYVCGYVQYDEDDATATASEQYGASVPYTLNPSSYPPARNLLFRNDGDRFTEVAQELGVANPEGRSLSALWRDFDDDGRPDLYVANDISDNAFYRNADGRFEDASHTAWVADYRGAMGLAAGDWNRDGDDDLFVTHWIAQENALYDSLLIDFAGREDGAGVRFMDVADLIGLGQIALQKIGWGTAFLDFDHDGWLDLIVANGSTFETDEAPKRLRPQPSFLFWNNRGEGFHELGQLNEAFAAPRVSRGLAVSDYDSDGDMDVALVDLDGGARLLRNDVEPKGNWLKVRLSADHGPIENARLIGRTGDAVFRRSVSSASYLSQDTRVVHFGLGDATEMDRLDVRWPSGAVEAHENLSANAVWSISQGDAFPRKETSLNQRQRVAEFWDRQRAAMRAMNETRDYEMAIGLFRSALELNPTHEDSIYYLGNTYAATGDVDAALNEFLRLRRLNPMSHRAFKRWGVLRATAAQSMDDLRAAAEALETAIRINPGETGAALALGEVSLMLGDLDSAERRFELACRSNPRAVAGLYFLAYIAREKGDRERAGALLERAREARGPEWKPEGAVAEGDSMIAIREDATPMGRFARNWDGTLDADAVFEDLGRRLETLRRK